LRFEIPPRDINANNFEASTIKAFFADFEHEVGDWNSDLDPETLVQFCHAFWWLKCDTAALRLSKAAQHLKAKIQTTDAWEATGSRCTDRLVVSLALGWKEELTASCNELVYNTMDDDNNMLLGFPSAVGKHSSLKRYSY
jgi:hypothetical protein